MHCSYQHAVSNNHLQWKIEQYNQRHIFLWCDLHLLNELLRKKLWKITSKKHKDISTYFTPSKKHKIDDESNSQLLATDNFKSIDSNEEYNIGNNEEVSVTTSPLLTDQNSNNVINVPVDLTLVYLFFYVLFEKCLCIEKQNIWTKIDSISFTINEEIIR